MKIERFEDIEAWQLARKLTNRVYELSDRGALSKDFGLSDQIRKAVGSSMHNIAEGLDAGSNPEFIRFLRYAKRSCTEVQSELYVALDRGYVSQEEFESVYELAGFTRGKIAAFMRYLKSSSTKNRQLQTANRKSRTVNREPRTVNRQP